MKTQVFLLSEKPTYQELEKRFHGLEKALLLTGQDLMFRLSHDGTHLDYFTPRAEVPTVTTEVDIEGGGRIQCYLTEVDVDKIGVGMPVEMTFRKYTPWQDIPLKEGVHTYLWESKPVRADVNKEEA